jgi:hypothetical protein
VDWDRDQWREWKRAQQDQWRNWKQDLSGQRDQWKDWQRAWKDQWARQWKEQWEEQWERQRQSHAGPPWAWLFGNAGFPFPFSGREESTESTEPQDAPPSDTEDAEYEAQSGKGTGKGRHGHGHGGSRHGFDWETFGPQVRDLFEHVRRQGGPLVEAARRHGPLSEAEQAEARAIIERAVAELRALFEGRSE